MSVSHLRTTVTTPEMRLMTVSPDLALFWLENTNTRNRPLSKARVDLYARNMSAGLWRHPTGEAIIFDVNGTLQDGQHRLAAQVQSNASIDYWVMENASPDDFAVIDQGRSRTAGQVVAMRGLKNHGEVAAIARATLSLIDHHTKTWNGSQVGNTQTVAFVESHAETLLRTSAEAIAAKNACRMHVTAYGAVGTYVALHSVGIEQWNDFHQSVLSGELLTEGMPVHTLRKWAINRQMHGSSSKVNLQTACVYIIKAWNHFVGRTEMHICRWRSTEIPMPLPTQSLY